MNGGKMTELEKEVKNGAEKPSGTHKAEAWAWGEEPDFCACYSASYQRIHSSGLYDTYRLYGVHNACGGPSFCQQTVVRF